MLPKVSQIAERAGRISVMGLRVRTQRVFSSLRGFFPFRATVVVVVSVGGAAIALCLPLIFHFFVFFVSFFPQLMYWYPCSETHFIYKS